MIESQYSQMYQQPSFFTSGEALAVDLGYGLAMPWLARHGMSSARSNYSTWKKANPYVRTDMGTFTKRLEQKMNAKNLIKQNRSLHRFGTKVGWGMLAVGLLSMGYELTKGAAQSGAVQRDEMAMQRAYYADSARSYMQRQRGMMAMHDSLSSLGPRLGNEARFMHR